MSVWVLCPGKMQNGRMDLLKDFKMQSKSGFNIQQSLVKAIRSSWKGWVRCKMYISDNSCLPFATMWGVEFYFWDTWDGWLVPSSHLLRGPQSISTPSSISWPCPSASIPLLSSCVDAFRCVPYPFCMASLWLNSSFSKPIYRTNWWIY